MNCANCGSPMRYDVAQYGLVCDHCGTVKPLPRPEEQRVVGEMDFASAVRGSNMNWGGARRLVSCKSCGANLLYDPDQMSGLCPFCGSAVVLSAEDADLGIAPNAVIPFSIPKEQVERRFYRWNKFAFWSPEKFRTGKVLGTLAPVYVPYWTFDADVVITYTGKFGYNTGSGDSERTNWYRKTGIVEHHVDDYRACASRRFAQDQLLNSVTDFSSRQLVDYTPDALTGMAAEVYTIGIDEAWNNAVTQGLKKDITRACQNHESADYCSELQFSTEYSNVTFRYVLVPVWLTGCKYGGKIYNVAASGHNGQGQCRRPFSVLKLVLFLLFIAAFFICAKILHMEALFLGLGFAAGITLIVIYMVMFFVALSTQKSEEQSAPPPQQ